MYPSVIIIGTLICSNTAEPTRSKCSASYCIGGKRVSITEYDEVQIVQEERKEGAYSKAVAIARNMLKDGDPISKVVRITELSENKVSELADELETFSHS